jgi:hypothetical protein
MHLFLSILAIIFVSFQSQTVFATSPSCFSIFQKNTDPSSNLLQTFETQGLQKVIHVAPNVLKNFERILSLLKDRKMQPQTSGLSIVVLPAHSTIDTKKAALIDRLLPQNIPIYKILDQIESTSLSAFLHSQSGVAFVEANLIDSFLKKLLIQSSQKPEIVFDGVYLEEKPELAVFLLRSQLDEFLLKTNSILYGVSSGSSQQQRERVMHYQTVFVEGQKLFSPGEFINRPYSFLSTKKPPRRQLKVLPWNDFYKLVKEKKFLRRKEYIAWVETEKPPGAPLHPEIAYASDWKGWEHLLGSKWLSFEDARKVAIAAGIKNQADFLAWGRRPPNFPSYPKGVYPEFTTWAAFLGSALRASPRLLQILPYEDALPVASAWARKNNVRTLSAYRERKDKPKGLPREPEKIYKDKGWISGDVFFGLVPPPSDLTTPKFSTKLYVK